eukprot:3623489-Amphidinium_carterae.1
MPSVMTQRRVWRQIPKFDMSADTFREMLWSGPIAGASHAAADILCGSLSKVAERVTSVLAADTTQDVATLARNTVLNSDAPDSLHRDE